MKKVITAISIFLLAGGAFFIYHGEKPTPAEKTRIEESIPREKENKKESKEEDVKEEPKKEEPKEVVSAAATLPEKEEEEPSDSTWVTALNGDEAPEEEVWEEEEEPWFPEPEEEPEIGEEPAIEPQEGLTYDQETQRGDPIEEPAPPLEIDYEQKGLEMILATYNVGDYDMVDISSASSQHLQYDFYVNAPGGDHVNLLGIYRYDMITDQLTFLNILTGVWE